MQIALSVRIYIKKKIILIFNQIWWLIESIFCSQFVFSEIGTKEFLIIYLFTSFLAQSGFANIREDPVLISFEVGENHQNCLENYIFIYWFHMNFDSHVKEENKTIASHMMRIKWPWYALKNSNMSCGFNSISIPLLNKQWKRNKHFKCSFLAENFKLLNLLSDVFFF